MKPCCWMLPKILVVSATAFKINAHALAIQKTMRALPLPSKGLLISNQRPTTQFGGDWVPIQSRWIPRGQWNRDEYSKFMLGGLAAYTKDFDFCITVQWDGYATNPERWDNGFLEYDYIGAPWPARMNIGRVGNGGFSLRSKTWIGIGPVALRQYPFESPGVKGSEDCYSCLMFRKFYIMYGMRIAPVDVAMKWSVEHPVEEFPGWRSIQSFGFHGFYHPDNKQYLLPE